MGCGAGQGVVANKKIQQQLVIMYQSSLCEFKNVGWGMVNSSHTSLHNTTFSDNSSSSMMSMFIIRICSIDHWTPMNRLYCFNTPDTVRPGGVYFPGGDWNKTGFRI